MWSSHKSGPFQEKGFPNIWYSHKGGPFQEVLYMLTEALALLLYRNLFLHTATRLWVWAGRPQPSTATLGRSAHLLQWGRQWYGLSPQVLPPTAAQLHMVVHMCCVLLFASPSPLFLQTFSLSVWLSVGQYACLELCLPVCFQSFPTPSFLPPPVTLSMPPSFCLFLALSPYLSFFSLSLTPSVCLYVSSSKVMPVLDESWMKKKGCLLKYVLKKSVQKHTDCFFLCICLSLSFSVCLSPILASPCCTSLYQSFSWPWNNVKEEKKSLQDDRIQSHALTSLSTLKIL